MSMAKSTPTGSPLSQFLFSPLVVRVIRTAISIAESTDSEVFTETLYFAIMGLAASENILEAPDEQPSADPDFHVLRMLTLSLNDTAGAQEQYNSQFAQYSADSHQSLEIGSTVPFAPEEDLPNFSNNATAVVEMAGRLAEGSSDSEIIALRHLLGGLISPRTGKEPHAPRYFEETGINLRTLRQSLLDLVVSYWPDDDVDVWRTELEVAPANNRDPDPQEGGDTLIDRLLRRKLAASTLSTDSWQGAADLIDGPKSWGLGPEIAAGDIIIIYFPKGLTEPPSDTSNLPVSTQKALDRLSSKWPRHSGLLFLLRAGAASQVAGPETNYRQVVEISETLELSEPLDIGSFTEPPLADWSLPKVSFQRAGQQRDPVSPEFAQALWTRILEKNPDLRPALENWVTDAPPPPVPEDDVSTHATSDLWTVDDKLGYAEYARAIYHFLDDPRTQPPLTISVQAPWGGGKTSLMRMVQQQLDPKGYELSADKTAVSTADMLKATTKAILNELRHSTKQKSKESTLDLEGGKCASIWFNAWRYQNSDQTWAGLAEAIIRGITDRLKPIEREKFLLHLHLSRVSADLVRSKIYDVAFRRFVDSLRRFGLLVLLFMALAAGLVWDVAESAAGGGVAAIIAGLIATGTAYLKARLDTEKEPAKLNLSDYVEVPNYSEKLGFVHHVTEDLRRVFDLLPKVEQDGEERRAPLAIFIDDLDRCSPAKVAEVFEAINLFVAGEFPNCYIIIGMDTEVVAAALEEAHQSVIRRLPSYAKRVPVGWRFMDKFVQLPFVIPPLGEEAVSNYALHLAAAEDRDAREVQTRASGDSARHAESRIRTALEQGMLEEEIVQQTAKIFVPKEQSPDSLAMAEARRIAKSAIESEKRKRYIDERARAFHSDSEKIQSLLVDAKEDFSYNPRELKRLVNVYRFYYNLRLARQSRGEPVPTEAQLKNWLKLALAWPEVVRWLRRSYTEWESDLDQESEAASGIGYRLSQLEALTVQQVKEQISSNSNAVSTRDPTVTDWAANLRSEFDLPEGVTWLEDERLFAFLHSIARQDKAERLSTGAGAGFW